MVIKSNEKELEGENPILELKCMKLHQSFVSRLLQFKRLDVSFSNKYWHFRREYYRLIVPNIPIWKGEYVVSKSEIRETYSIY